jgi:hypothetical protein
LELELVNRLGPPVAPTRASHGRCPTTPHFPAHLPPPPARLPLQAGQVAAARDGRLADSGARGGQPGQPGRGQGASPSTASTTRHSSTTGTAQHNSEQLPCPGTALGRAHNPSKSLGSCADTQALIESFADVMVEHLIRRRVVAQARSGGWKSRDEGGRRGGGRGKRAFGAGRGGRAGGNARTLGSICPPNQPGWVKACSPDGPQPTTPNRPTTHQPTTRRWRS